MISIPLLLNSFCRSYRCCGDLFNSCLWMEFVICGVYFRSLSYFNSLHKSFWLIYRIYFKFNYLSVGKLKLNLTMNCIYKINSRSGFLTFLMLLLNLNIQPNFRANFCFNNWKHAWILIMNTVINLNYIMLPYISFCFQVL